MKQREINDMKEKEEVELNSPVNDEKFQEPLEAKKLYTQEDIERISYIHSLPGSFPYLRGTQSTMYTTHPWTIRQYLGFSTAEETNEFYRQCLSTGQKGLSVAFDLPTHRGYDSDHPRALIDVGKTGVAVDTVEDMKILFNQIPLDQISVSMTMNGAVLPVFAAFIVAAEELGIPQYKLMGTIQNDILKEFIVRNTYIYPPLASMRISTDIIEYVTKSMPKFNSISISGYHMQEAGANAVQELAFTFANALEYTESALQRGLNIDEFAPRFSFFFGVGINFFVEIAKLRAARVLWAQLMQPYASRNPKSSQLRMHCQTSGYSLTAQEPFNNIIRVTIEALAAALGGTQSLHTNSFDEALGLPTDQSQRIARNTQLILQEETDICKVIDPLGGSWFVESLTQSLINETKILLEKINSMGGMLYLIEKGVIKKWIEEAAIRKQAYLEQGTETIVGMNKYQSTEEPTPIREIDNVKVRAKQVSKLLKIKVGRNPLLVEQSLNDLKHAATTNGNLLQYAIAAIRARATIGEVSLVLENVFGRYEAVNSSATQIYLNAYSNPAELNTILSHVNEFINIIGRRPRILIAKLGQDGHDRGAKLIASGFADLGFDVDLAPLFQTPAEIIKQAVQNDVHVIGISSLTGSHKMIAEELSALLKQENAQDIILVFGGVIPRQDYEALAQSGIKLIFGPGTQIPVAAQSILKLILDKYE